MEVLHPNYYDRIHSFPNIPNLNVFRKGVEINDPKCSVTIKYLHVGDKVDLFKKNLIIKSAFKEIDFKVTIRSKESTRVLSPNVSIKYEELLKVFFETKDDY